MNSTIARNADETRVEQVRSLLSCLEGGNGVEAMRLLNQIVLQHSPEMLQELVRMTRDLHEAVHAFRSDERLSQIADCEIQDAKQRLNYVITMTEQAAGRTLTAVEGTRPFCVSLQRQASTLLPRVSQLGQGQADGDEVRQLCADLVEFLAWSGAMAKQSADHLSDVLMAQTFQDLTGQMIRRVITLVDELEQSLVKLIRLCWLHGDRPSNTPPEEDGLRLDGPRVPGVRGSQGSVSGQDEVDNLLSGLGF